MKKHFSFRQTPNVFTTVSRHFIGSTSVVETTVKQVSVKCHSMSATCLPPVLIGTSLELHRNFIGTSSRHYAVFSHLTSRFANNAACGNNKRLYRSTMGFASRKVAMSLLLFALSFGFSSQAWGLDKLRVQSSFDSWVTHDINNAGDTYTYLAVPAGTFYLRAHGGDNYSASGDVIGNRYSGTITNNIWGKPSGWNDDAMQLTISEVSDVTITRGENGWDILASGIPSPYYIKYSWNGETDWKWSNALTSEGDGKYSCIGQYGDTEAYNYNRKKDDTGSGYNTTATIIGEPSKGDQCVFTFNSSDNSLTIRKCSYVEATSHVYFDNSSANWNDSYIQFVIGRPATTGDEYSGQYKFSSITNTKLLYVAIGNNWNDVAYYAIMGTSSAYNGTKWYIPNVYNADHYSAAYTNKYDLQKDMVTLVKKDNATNKGAISLDYISSGYTDFNKTQTVKVMVKKAGASNYTEETTFANWPGSIKAKRYTLNSNGASSANETDADLESATFTSVITSEATLTATAAAGYVFKGWGESSSSSPSSTSSKTYTVSDETTTYAFFEETTYQVNYGVHESNHGELTAKANDNAFNSGDNVKASVNVVFTATPATGYHVEGWYDNSDCSTGKIDAAGIDDTYTINSLDAAANVYVKFAANTYSVMFNGNESTSGSMSNQAFTYDETAKALTANDFARTGYTFQGWATSVDGEKVYEDGASVQNLTNTNGGTFNLYAVWQEKTYSGITVASNSTDKGTVNINTATFGISTGQEITATPKDGYYVESWTLPDHAVIASGEGTNTITVKASGDEEVFGTIIANFAERWVLRGSTKASDSELGGMPGWNTTDAVFTFAADATEGTKTVTLLPNRIYKFKIYDRQGQANHGQKNEDQKMTSDGEFWKLDGEYDVLFDAKGYGVYTFKVKNSSDDNTLPEVKYIEVPSHLITMGTKTFSNDAVSAGDGGTITAKTTENETDFDVTTEQYVREGGSIVFTAMPAKGYSFAGFYSDAACTNQITTGVTDNIYTTTITDATSVYAKFTEKLTTVVIDWDGDGKVQVKDGSGNWTDATKGTTTVQAGVYTHPSVNAVVTDGSSHYFAKWAWNDNADFEADDWDENHVETTVIGFGQGLTSGQTLTAKFLELDKIYFNNGFPDAYKWTYDDIHVYFGVSWDNNLGVCPTGKDYLKMNKIENTDIYWVYVPRYVFSNHNEGSVAFSEHDMSSYTNFNGYHGVYRTDWNVTNNMYVPKSGGEPKNNCYYFSEGYWMRYEGYTPGDEMGYKLFLNDPATDHGQFIATSANEGQIKCRIDKTGEVSFCIKSQNESVGYGTNQKFTNVNTSQLLSRYGSNYAFTVNVESEGDYTFILTLGESNQMKLTIDYPVGVGDYRVAWTDGSSNKHYSDVVKSNEASEAHTLSMYLNPSEGNLKLQRCTGITAGVPQWSEGTDIAWTDFINGQGVYQFDITIATEDNAALTNVRLYTGNYYIKTDGVKGGWGNYKENIMDENTSTFSETDATTYDRYYCQWISNEGKNYNVKCVIANDYCNALSDTLRGDDYTEMSGTEPLLPQPANVRFSYNTYTNTLKRDYISGSTDDADRFLMLLCDNSMMYDKTNETLLSELKFTDKNNWVYQADIKAQPGCAVKLTANYNGKGQYFIGDTETSKAIITSTSEDDTKYTMRVVYDFKTNRLVAGWMPSNTEITTDISLGGDMLITRTHQGNAQQITFGVNQTTGEDGQISDIHHVYGVLTLNKTTMTADDTKPGGSKYYENNLYWISFPFKVKISEIFGVDGYGTKWILQRYRGDLRAQKGWFAETATFWEYMSASDTLKAYEGYVLCLDPNYFNPKDAAVWDNSAEEANFYFPSADNQIGLVNAATFKQSVPEHVCKINRTFTVAGHVGDLNHTVTDSHWNVIGVPAFQDKSLALGEETKTDLKAIYEWNSADNTYTPHALNQTFSFKTMHAYMVQFAGDITWADVSVVDKDIPKTEAPRRLKETANYMAEIEFHQGNKANDHTYINLADNAATDFVLNEDMMKIDNAGCPNIYSFAGNYNVAYNETSKASQTIDLGVSAPAAGNYKFHMPSDFTGTVTLIDNVEQTRTDLQVQDYELYLDKGTYNDRFQLEINLQSVVTNLDNVFGGQLNSDHAVKFIRDDKLFILRSGRIYDATGKRMK